MEMNGLNKINLEISMKKKMVYENLESVVITWKFARFSRLIFSAFEFVGENIFILQSVNKVRSISPKTHDKRSYVCRMVKALYI